MLEQKQRERVELHDEGGRTERTVLLPEHREQEKGGPRFWSLSLTIAKAVQQTRQWVHGTQTPAAILAL